MEQVPVKVPGNTLTATEFNNLDSQEAQNCVSFTDQLFDSSNNFQLLQAFLRIASSGNQYIDSGVANNYVLHDASNYAPLTTFPDRTVVRFTPLNTNTGACTASINDIIGFNIVDLNGNPLVGGELQAGEYVTLVNYGGGANFRVAVFNDEDLTLRLALQNQSQDQSGTRIVGADSTTENNIVPFAIGFIFWNGGAYVLNNGVNIAQINRLGVGRIQIIFAISLPTTGFNCEVAINSNSSGRCIARVESYGGNSVIVALSQNNGSAADLSFYVDASLNLSFQTKRRR